MPTAGQQELTFALDRADAQGYVLWVISVERLRAITAVVMAYAVVVILVSPLVPSPMTTVPFKHTLQPPQFVAPVTALLFTAAVDTLQTVQWLNAEIDRVPMSGTDVVDLTTARLC